MNLIDLVAIVPFYVTLAEVDGATSVGLGRPPVTYITTLVCGTEFARVTAVAAPSCHRRQVDGASGLGFLRVLRLARTFRVFKVTSSSWDDDDEDRRFTAMCESRADTHGPFLLRVCLPSWASTRRG